MELQVLVQASNEQLKIQHKDDKLNSLEKNKLLSLAISMLATFKL
jgi:hypothetical protein